VQARGRPGCVDWLGQRGRKRKRRFSKFGVFEFRVLEELAGTHEKGKELEKLKGYSEKKAEQSYKRMSNFLIGRSLKAWLDEKSS
jgi:hypothetical protein